MAAAAISSVSGGFAQQLRTIPGEERRPEEGGSPARERASAGPVDPSESTDPGSTILEGPRFAPGREPSSGFSDGRAILDENELSERAERLEQARSLGGRSLEAQLEIASLQARDAEVRRHEAAHVAAGDGYVVGGATYSYQIGPDGKHYAVGGQVEIDTSPIPGNPEETLRKMRVVRAAALASGQPSAADLAIASAAAQAEAAALAELTVARSRELAERYAGEMALGRSNLPAAAARPAAGLAAATLRDDGPPPTPFDVIA